mmetsp:Transcript_35284/g.75173  ORF Transcript_35284/g.75173 Transcript_35284/m.75173 type:complete len:274 (+) Transcript_35284:901-1722(+)
MEGHNQGVLARIPALGRVTMGLAKLPIVVVAPDSEHLAQTLIYEHVLAPPARALAQLLEVGCARSLAPGPSHHSIPGEDLNRPMQAVLAVVEVHSLRALRVLLQCSAEPPWKKDRVRIHLHSPVVIRVPAIVDDLVPHCQEDVGVQCCLKLASIVALEIAVDGGGHHPGCYRQLHVAVYCELLTSKNARMLFMLHLNESALVARRQHHGETEERAGLVGRRVVRQCDVVGYHALHLLVWELVREPILVSATTFPTAAAVVFVAGLLARPTAIA